MNKIEFQDYPSTETPLNAENLNQMQTNIEEEINKAKTVTLTGGWLHGVNANGGATSVIIPIFNPTNTKPTLSNMSGAYFDGTGGWKDITNITIRTFGITFVELSMEAGNIGEGVLLALVGTIQAQ